MPIDMPKPNPGGSGFSRALGQGKKVAALMSGNPATIGSAFADPNSAGGALLALGTKIATGGGGAGEAAAAAGGSLGGGDGSVGPAPSIKSDPFSRRYRGIAGPGVF